MVLEPCDGYLSWCSSFFYSLFEPDKCYDVTLQSAFDNNLHSLEQSFRLSTTYVADLRHRALRCYMQRLFLYVFIRAFHGSCKLLDLLIWTSSRLQYVPLDRICIQFITHDWTHCLTLGCFRRKYSRLHDVSQRLHELVRYDI